MMLDLSAEMIRVLLVSTGVLVVLLVVSFLSRPRVFTEYLAHMTGIKLKPRDVARVYKRFGKPGVREMFLELIIREDLRDGPRITPDTPAEPRLLAPEDKP